MSSGGGPDGADAACHKESELRASYGKDELERAVEA